MSDRGSILISTANDIGEALVEKLGGEGYAPSVWDKEYNKLGIAEVDSAPALSVLEDSSETGTARGSILLSTANAIGAMLNKKYNTDRGFKPKEWASAASKLAPLPQKSAESASICSIEDGADDVPTKSLVVTIPPTLSGTSLVSETQTGRNLFDKSAVTANTWIIVNSTETEPTNSYSTSDYIPVKANTRYYVSFKDSNRSAYYDKNMNGIAYFSFNGNASFTALYDGYIRITIKNDIDLDTFIVNEGTEAITYEPYSGTTYTASLGRTIYGGTADIVNGGGQETHQEIDLGSLTWIYASASNRFYANLHLSGIYTNFPTNANELADITCADYETITFSSLSGDSSLNNKVAGVTTDAPFLTIRDTRFSNATDFKNAVTGKKAVIPLATTIDFTFDGQEINTRLGYNAFWSDQGNTALDYYGEPEPYTRGTASGAIANVQSARTDLPFTQVKANIAPNLTGVESVEVTKAGKNLFDNTGLFPASGSVSSYYFKQFDVSSGLIPEIHLKAGATYTFTVDVTSTIEPFNLSVGCGNGVYSTDILAIYNKNSGRVSITFTPTAAQLSNGDVLAFRCPRYGAQNTFDYSISNAQLEVGSTATEYTPYEEPTVYTADLGEPVYGGSVDLVTGEKVKTSARLKISDLNWSIQTVSGRSAFVSGQVSNMPTTSPKIVLCDVLPYDGEKTIGDMTDKTLATWTNTFRIYDTDIADVTELISTYGNGYITYPLVTDIESSITPQVISPSEGVNNLWNNAGGDTDVEYFEQE